MSRKLKRKELHLKEDEFVTQFARVVAFVREHRDTASYAVVGTAVVAAIAALVAFQVRSGRAEAQEVLSQGWSYYLQSQESAAVAEGTPAPRAENLAKAAEAFQEVLDQHASSPAAAEARYLLAITRFENGDAEGALQAYRDYSERHPDGTLTRAARFGEAASLEDLGRRDEAIAVLNGLKADETAGDTLLLDMETARLHRLAERSDQALELYRKVYLEDPDGVWGREAQSWILRLGGSLPEPSRT